MAACRGMFAIAGHLGATITKTPGSWKVNTPSYSTILIRAYGLYWDRDSVHWSKQGGASGHVKGVRKDNRKSSPVDFSNQNGIYTLYDDFFNLLYIGQTGTGDATLFQRLSAHRRGNLGLRWRKFSWFGTRYVKNDGALSKKANRFGPELKDVLNSLEAIVLATARPPANKKGGNFGGAVEYIQFRDSAVLGPTESEMIKELYGDLLKRQET